MKRKIKKLLNKLTLTEIIAVIMVFVAIVILAWSLITGISNEANRINEGVIVDKRYHAAYTTTTYSGSSGNRIAIPHYHPERYVFTIEGEKGDKIVQYTFEVTVSQYEQYSIGDYYKR